LDLRLLGEEIAVGDHQVGDLPHLDRPQHPVHAEQPRRRDGERLERGVRGKAPLDRLADVLHEVPGFLSR
jgi:hypothetical protein